MEHKHSPDSDELRMVKDAWSNFLEVSVGAALITAFFPWSLLFCAIVFGLRDTGALIVRMFNDIVWTLLGIAIGIVLAVSVIGGLLAMLMG